VGPLSGEGSHNGRATRSPRVSGTTPQREYRNGQPAESETVWALSERGKVARLVLLTQVCRSDREIEDVSAA